MAQIGYGYGSEWHLLRFLGHHRERLEDEIRKQLKLGECKFKWLDFDFADRKDVISGDQELKGLDFLGKKGCFPEYPLRWNQSWDAVVYINDTLYLVEAKAHVTELGDKSSHGGTSRQAILEFMSQQMAKYGCHVTVEESTWLGEYYQMANRLATAAYLNNKGYSTKVLYIYFENGFYTNDSNNCDATKEEFQMAISKEKETLGINNDSKINEELLCEVFIDATGKK